MNTYTISDSAEFTITYSFFDETHETELSMLINGNNILAFERNDTVLTTRWNLDELAEWLRNFIDHMADDPYPVESDGEYAAMKDISARDFDTDDEDEFDAYYDKLYEWNLRHRWHPHLQERFSQMCTSSLSVTTLKYRGTMRISEMTFIFKTSLVAPESIKTFSIQP